MTPGDTVLAHGLGGSSDLPIPLTAALIGAAWALTFTFAVVALAWRTPKFDPGNPAHVVPGLTRIVDSPVIRWLAALLALAFAVWVVLAGWLGPAQEDSNPLPGVFYVLLWVGLVGVSVLFGPVWRLLSPIRTLTLTAPRCLRRGRVAYPAWLGYYPGAAGLFAFVWLELASPHPASPSAVKIWIICYTAVMLAGVGVFGDRWLTRGDPFDVYSVVVCRLSPFRRDPASGRIAIGNPFDHLPSLPIRPGLVVVLAVLLGSTAFDSFSATPGWRNLVDGLSDGSAALATSIRTAGLAVFILVVATTFSTAARATGGVNRYQRRKLPGELAHSLVPIVVGYVFAHYLTYLVERGQRAVIALVDPFDRGWNPLGLAGADVSYVLSTHPAVLSSLKVSFVLAGHIVAVIAAHDRALRILPKDHQLTGQLAMMLVMVFYTFMGLYLLFGG